MTNREWRRWGEKEGRESGGGGRVIIFLFLTDKPLIYKMKNYTYIQMYNHQRWSQKSHEKKPAFPYYTISLRTQSLSFQTKYRVRTSNDIIIIYTCIHIQQNKKGQRRIQQPFFHEIKKSQTRFKPKATMLPILKLKSPFQFQSQHCHTFRHGDSSNREQHMIHPTSLENNTRNAGNLPY